MTTPKKQATWKHEGIFARYYLPNGKIVECDLTLLFPEYREFDDVQKKSIYHAMKRKVVDTTAKRKEEKLTDDEKFAVMTAEYKRLITDRKWNVEGRTRTPSIAVTKVATMTSGITEIMEKFNIPEEAAKAIKAQMDALNV